MRIRYLVKGASASAEAGNVNWSGAFDVVVVGLGTAGAVAAIVAAESGLRTAGVERLDGMGGQGTLGFVWDYYYGIPGGRLEEINRQCADMTARGYVPSKRPDNEESYPGYIKDYLLEECFLRAGGSLWEETTVTGVYLEDGKICGLRCLRQGKTIYWKAAVVIDATANAAICRMAGCKLLPLRESDGKAQTYSHTVGVYQAGGYIQSVYTHSGQMAPENNEIVTRAHLTSAAQPFCLHHQFGGRMLAEGGILGCREGFRIDSLANITLENSSRGAPCAHPLFYAFSHVDNLSRDIAFESDCQQDWHMIADLWTVGLTVPVPLEALLPQGASGLIAAGKCIGVEHDLAGCIRMKRDMEKCGEAAAVLACASVSQRVPPAAVPYETVAAPLRESGCLARPEWQGWQDLRFPPDAPERRLRLPETEMEITHALASKEPGRALWALRLWPRKQAEALLARCMESEQAPLREHAALAAGMLRLPRAIPLLRLISHRLAFPPREPRQKYLYPDACRAICLLGRLADTPSVPWLLHIVETPGLLENIDIPKDDFCPTREDYYFQYFSNAFVALLRIAKKDPSMKAEILPRLKGRVLSPDFAPRITRARIDPTDTFRLLLRRAEDAETPA